MATVELKNVRKTFGRNVIAVDRLDLEVKDKEFMVLVGPSGCGKSTSLRMVAGLEEVDEGEISIGGKLVNDVPAKDRDIAMVFQNYALYPHMTAYQNMAFGLRLRKYPQAEIDKRVREAAEILGISELLHRKPKALSGGESQRVAVGRAIVRKPKVFLFDEPLSNLDAKLRVQMRAEISKLHARLKATTIYVTHDQLEAMTMGERIAVMRDGLLQQVDQPLQLYHKPTNKFVAGFIGSPTMNFIEGIIEKTENSLVFDEGLLKIEIPSRYYKSLNRYIGKPLIFGLRPEEVHYLDSAEYRKETAEIPATVDVVEPMGNEAFLHLIAGKSRLVASTRTSTLPQMGEKIKLTLDLSRAHFFDKETEVSLL
ncbi:MAG: sn-glycerol-3-phosphate ABC transporter ATP-binding protein UgpC [Candidatus Latescibacteria bacterium]|nr:sn-glycerol-3-phosphate ABC transporter ATP-binding protein UgpC [Candidatus Latescibacterota bacterium]